MAGKDVAVVVVVAESVGAESAGDVAAAEGIRAAAAEPAPDGAETVVETRVDWKRWLVNEPWPLQDLEPTQLCRHPVCHQVPLLV